MCSHFAISSLIWKGDQVVLLFSGFVFISDSPDFCVQGIGWRRREKASSGHFVVQGHGRKRRNGVSGMHVIWREALLFGYQGEIHNSERNFGNSTSSLRRFEEWSFSFLLVGKRLVLPSGRRSWETKTSAGSQQKIQTARESVVSCAESKPGSQVYGSASGKKIFGSFKFLFVGACVLCLPFL